MTTWPTSDFQPTEEQWRRASRLQTSGISISGLVAGGETTGGGFWVCEQAGILINTPAKIRQWRALETVVGDGITAFDLPLYENALRPDPTGAMTATLASNAALRATTASVTASVAPTAGSKFTIDHSSLGKRLYAVGSVSGSGPYTVTFWPPLRAAESTSKALNFNTPSLKVRIADPASFGLNLVAGSYAEKSVTFVEAF